MLGPHVRRVKCILKAMTLVSPFRPVIHQRPPSRVSQDMKDGYLTDYGRALLKKMVPGYRLGWRESLRVVRLSTLEHHRTALMHRLEHMQCDATTRHRLRWAWWAQPTRILRVPQEHVLAWRQCLGFPDGWLESRLWQRRVLDVVLRRDVTIPYTSEPLRFLVLLLDRMPAEWWSPVITKIFSQCTARRLADSASGPDLLRALSTLLLSIPHRVIREHQTSFARVFDPTSEWLRCTPWHQNDLDETGVVDAATVLISSSGPLGRPLHLSAGWRLCSWLERCDFSTSPETVPLNLRGVVRHCLLDEHREIRIAAMRASRMLPKMDTEATSLP